MARREHEYGGSELEAVEDALGIRADLEQLRRLQPPSQSSERRQRIVDSVFEQAALQAATAPRPTRLPTLLRRRAKGMAIAALAAAALLAVWTRVGRRPGDGHHAVADVQPQRALGFRLSSGRIEVDGEPLQDGAPIAARSLTSALDQPARFAFADGSILDAQPRTSLVYGGDSGAEERIELRHGQVSLQVQPRSRHNPLVVQTAELSARVVGTRFEVTRDERDARLGTTVRVQEGLVRVVSRRDGVERLLAAGEHVTVRASEPERGSQAERAAEAQPTSVEGDSAESSGAGREPAAIAAASPAPVPGPRTQAPKLSLAVRRKLDSGQVEAARSLLRDAERERTLDGLELALLQAEADLAEHHPERAKGRYLAIVAQHPGSPEAELSLFAAGQLSQGQAGIDLLQRYLARYPHGRFAKEAHRLLQALDPH